MRPCGEALIVDDMSVYSVADETTAGTARVNDAHIGGTRGNR